MPLVQAKCTNCAGNLQVEDTKDAAICPYCGTPFIVEKAIKNFIGINIENSGTVNIYGNGNSDFEIVAGVLKSYKGASPDVVIPSNVTAIECFFPEGVTSIYIPDSVTDISHGVFYVNKSLKSIRWPRAFENQPIKKMNCFLPANYPIRLESNIRTNVNLLVFRLWNSDTPYYTDLLETGLYLNFLNSVRNPRLCFDISESIHHSCDNGTLKCEMDRAIKLSDIGIEPVRVIEVPYFKVKVRPLTKKTYLTQDGTIKALNITLPFINSSSDS